MENPRVKDLMLPLSEYATISAEKTIRDALLSLSKAQLGLTQDRHQHRAVLVLNNEGQVIGKLSHWAILRSLDVDFLRTDDLASLARSGLSDDFIDSMKASISGLSTSLQTMCGAAAKIRARDAMVPVGESINEWALLTEAIRTLVTKHTQSLMVTRGNQIVGILRLSDVFKKVATMIEDDDFSKT